VLGFEPHIRSAVALLFKKWDHFYDTAVIRKEVTHEGCFQGRDCRVWFDCLDCALSPHCSRLSPHACIHSCHPGFNYLAFDIIGDLAFGTPFGMLEAGRDAAPVLAPGETPDKTRYLPAIEILNDRGTYSASLGVTPVWSRPLVKRLPWFARGCRAVDDLVGVRNTLHGHLYLSMSTHRTLCS
jgi:benzoate 4-monooxygenase